jgi:hypothetical protein
MLRPIVNLALRAWRRLFPVPGTVVQIRKRRYIVPEASLEAAERVLPALDKLKADTDGVNIYNYTATVVCLCLVENYPGLSVKAMKRQIPIGRAIETMNEVLRAAGFSKPAEKAGEEKPGEAGRP